MATGTIAGLAAALALTRLMTSQIWGVSATDPWTFSAVAALILVVGLTACLFPARKATQVDPHAISQHSGPRGALHLPPADQRQPAGRTVLTRPSLRVGNQRNSH